MPPNNDHPAIITVAPTGPLTSRSEHPGVPLTPTEIGIAVAEAADAGAAVAHIHARDDEGRPTADPDIYRAIITEIEARCDVVVQASTGVGLDVSQGERLSIITDGELQVPMATLNPASMTFARATFQNEPWFVESLADALRVRGITPELEVYDFGHVSICLELLAKGLVKAPPRLSFVMGVRGGMPGDPALLPALIAMLPADSTWQTIGIGRAQLPLTLASVALGGHIRVGLEDNVYWRRGQLADSNAQLVQRAAEIIKVSGRPLASADDVRAQLGHPGHSVA
jgi:3-keto-5-aminohexanoate cleavage enzyme